MRFKAEVARAAMLFDARKKTQATSKRERSTLNAGLVSLERSDILHILMDPLLMARNCAWWNKTLQGLQAVESESCPEITYPLLNPVPMGA
ncbi:hypothetical protein CC1G_06475 [Coprinopsis cinerea okayama7|uniref:Uncharacterized protein n=1 Tax=Coprinopsis cinerea (strain Okayama-7 / 130 / ATCC MYA-4618 / FGSC 9003) TaxID=240176 RepID=A8NN88_COPC7|nr:hypothetical protein CC1G_06475 [Coprinopsis cinerea okayama7\|eukprot:XP_001835072.1 hypothetical protein CC1G_06475 [Coprinopsis cinerea okayama7\